MTVYLVNVNGFAEVSVEGVCHRVSNNGKLIQGNGITEDTRKVFVSPSQPDPIKKDCLFIVKASTYKS